MVAAAAAATAHTLAQSNLCDELKLYAARNYMSNSNAEKWYIESVAAAAAAGRHHSYLAPYTRRAHIYYILVPNRFQSNLLQSSMHVVHIYRVWCVASVVCDTSMRIYTIMYTKCRLYIIYIQHAHHKYIHQATRY